MCAPRRRMEMQMPAALDSCSLRDKFYCSACVISWNSRPVGVQLRGAQRGCLGTLRRLNCSVCHARDKRIQMRMKVLLETSALVMRHRFS